MIRTGQERLRPAQSRWPGGRRRTLVAVEMMTGAAGLAGGVLLAAAPDGSLLRADPAVLADSPFRDWRTPGVLLAGLVGGGFMLAGWWQWRDYRYARELSLVAGAGLITFEAAEVAWIGYQPLEAVFAMVGLAVIPQAPPEDAISAPPQVPRQAGPGTVRQAPSIQPAPSRHTGTMPAALT